MSDRPQLPPGWRMVRFDQVARHIKVDVVPEESGLERYVAGEHMDTDSLRIRRWGTLGDGYLGPAFHRKFTSGQVLYGSRRTYLRKVAVADFDGVCANTTFVIEPNTKEVVADLLPFVMQTEAFTEFSVKHSKGSVNPYINWKDIAAYEFPLPPKDEQRRIVDVLSSAADVYECWTAANDRLLRAAKAIRQAVFGPTEFRRWGQAKLGELFEVQLGKALSPREEAGTPLGPYLRNANVLWRSFDLEDIKEMPFSTSERRKYLMRNGDLMVCEARAVGRSAIWDGAISPCYYQNALHRLGPIEDKYSSALMVEYLAFASETGLLIPLTGESTIPHLTAVKLKQLQVPVPPQATQKQLEHVFTILNGCIERATTAQAKSKALYQRLLSHFLDTAGQTVGYAVNSVEATRG